MQPQFKQTPPSTARSITITRFLSCASRIAATYPPGPAPTTATSARFSIDHSCVNDASSGTSSREGCDSRESVLAGLSEAAQLTELSREVRRPIREDVV